MEDLIRRAVFTPDRRFKAVALAWMLLITQGIFFMVIANTHLHILSAPMRRILIGNAAFTLLLLLEGVLLTQWLKKDAEKTSRTLLQMLLDGTNGEVVTVEKLGKLAFFRPRAVRKATGIKDYRVEYYYRPNESFEAYLFILPKNPLNFFRQSKFIIPKGELDRLNSRAA